MDIINITCGEIQSSVGFLYVILPVILNHTNNPDCEQSWHSEAHFSHVTAYRVRNQTAVTPNSDLQQVTPDLQHSDHFWWLLAVFIIALLIIILICLMKRKRIFRCFQRLIFQRDDDDSENRDPEAAVQMKLRSDAPDSLNQSDSEQLNGSLSRG
ncbi:hypothetical protein ROHU_000965 [Labeo rohita]|uniref:Uncharacterized protein n=1 Tax=Labeo rohita TaxID=84645 RepID=A0A498P504_LABRO|nr:hypothetical protein ROHU_000965 [Labeo rohita]